jgi:hypothetical protein
LTAVPSQRDALVPIYKYLDGLQRQRQSIDDAATARNADAPPDESGPSPAEQKESTDKLFEHVQNRPWTTAKFPLVAKWAEKNQKQLDRLVEASQRPRCYFPSYTMFNQKPDMMFNMSLAGDQGSREVGRSLLARAMWNVGEDRLNEAWTDLIAIYRTGSLVAQGESLVSELIGIALSGMAFDGTVALLSETPPADLARKMLQDLNGLGPFDRAADVVDSSERFAFAESVIAISRGELDPKLFDPNADFADVNYLQRINIDWNVVLRKGNEFYDRFVVALKLQDPAARQAALARIQNDIEKAASPPDPSSFFAAVVNPSARADIVTSHMIGLLLPAIAAFDAHETRANAQLEVTRLGAALAVFHAEQGAYPAKLEELVPTVLEKLPADPFGNAAFFYQRTADGYLLYSAGENLIDDHASNGRYATFEGIRMQALDEAAAAPYRDKLVDGTDDISIRVPRVPSKIPESKK